jgi:hypothetical protein
MKLNKAIKRDNKRNKKKHGMRIDGKSVFLTINIQVEKAKKIKKEKQ